MEQSGFIEFEPESEDRTKLSVAEQNRDLIEFEPETEDRKKVSPEERKHEFSKAKLTAAMKILLALGGLFAFIAIADIIVSVFSIEMDNSMLFSTAYNAIPNAALLILGFYFGQESK